MKRMPSEIGDRGNGRQKRIVTQMGTLLLYILFESDDAAPLSFSGLPMDVEWNAMGAA